MDKCEKKEMSLFVFLKGGRKQYSGGTVLYSTVRMYNVIKETNYSFTTQSQLENKLHELFKVTTSCLQCSIFLQQIKYFFEVH